MLDALMMKPTSLSIVIACWNEPENLAGTIQSIEDTAAGLPLEIIIINDGGAPFHLDAKLSTRLKILRNPTRLGHAACRQRGAEAAEGEWLLFTDAHMVFEPHWYEGFEVQTRLADSKTLFCGPYVASRIEWEAGNHPPDLFWGARLYYWERDGDAIDVLNHKPIVSPPSWEREWSFEVPCVIGANYFIRRDWFETIDGLKHLCGWSGMDEFMLSLKTWLFGGTVKLIPDVRLRHVLHPTGHGTNGYSKQMTRAELLFNKLSAAYQIFPSHIYETFLTALPRKGDDEESFRVALRMISERREGLEQSAFYFRRNIRRDHDWLCSKFQLYHPQDIGAASYMFAAPSSVERMLAV